MKNTATIFLMLLLGLSFACGDKKTNVNATAAANIPANSNTNAETLKKVTDAMALYEKFKKNPNAGYEERSAKWKRDGDAAMEKAKERENWAQEARKKCLAAESDRMSRGDAGAPKDCYFGPY